MKLKYLKLKNFRQYYGEQTIRFACESPCHVTVIQGINGTGKSSLFNALNWCLYGEDVGQIGELVNKRAITESIGTVETSVEIGFTHEYVQYIAERKHKGFLLQHEIKTIDNEEFLLSQIDPNGQFEPVIDPEWKVASILPANVRTYFFFDGEQIDNFAKPGPKKEIREAVRNVLKIEAIERAKRHLDDVAREYQSELRKHASGKLKELMDQIEKKQIERDELSKDLGNLQKEVTTAKEQKHDIDARLSEIESARRLSEKRQAIEDERQKLQQREAALWLEIREGANRGFICLTRPALDKAMNILEQKRERGEIPSGIRETFLNDLLDEMRCICGRPIHDGSEEHQNLLNQLNQAVSSRLEDTVLETRGYLKDLLLSRVKEIPTQLVDLMKQRRSLDDEIESKEGHLAKISEQLKNFDAEEVGNLERSRREQEKNIRELEASIDYKKGGIDQIKKELEELNQQIRKEKEVETRAKWLKRCYSLTSDSAEAARKMYDRFAHDMREIIQAEAQRIFKQLIWKETHFQDVLLNEAYELNVIDRYNLNAHLEMSAGERQVLSLAFIAGMAEVAKEKETFPLVMDTPFGRLSSAHREKITEHLPEITDQLILFVTDEELHGKARENLEPRVGAKYELIFDQATSSTEIREVL